MINRLKLIDELSEDKNSTQQRFCATRGLVLQKVIKLLGDLRYF
jgi:hypothetical protein